LRIIFFQVISKINRGDQAAAKAIKQLLKKKFRGAKIISRNVKKLHLLTQKEIQMLENSDLIVIGGGGQYSKWLYPKSSKHLKKICTPIIIYSVGHLKNFEGEELTKKQKEKIKELNAISSLSSVRDATSLKFIKSLGLEADLVCDPAIFLKTKNKRKNKSKKTYLGINIASHGWANQDKWLNKIIGIYIEFIKTLNDKEKISVYYFKHSPKENEIIKKLRKEIKNFIIIDEKPRKMLQKYAKMDFFIGMMLHSTILAFNANTPMISVAYDEKNKSFMELIGMQKYCISYKKLSTKMLLKLFRTEKRKRKSIEKHMAKKKKELINQHDIFLEKANVLLKQKK
jgi:polysaccharide pyruvyl transferase WcaK-like protein